MDGVAVLINSLSAGGAEKVVSVIVEELVKAGYRVKLILLEREEFYRISKKVDKIYLSSFKGNENKVLKFLLLPILAWRLKRIIKGNNLRIVQSHMYRANFVNILAKMLGASHKVQIVNAGIVSRYLSEGLAGKISFSLVKYLYPRADLIVWKSKGMKIDGDRVLNLRNRQRVIYNPIDMERILELSDEEVRDFHFDQDKVYVVSVGRLVRLKRNEDLIRALSYLDNNVEVLFIGDGSEKESLFKLSKELGVEDRVHFIGRVKNPYKYLLRSHIFVHTSETEGFPNVILEALACGVPVISSDCLSGPREILAPDTDITKQLKKGEGFELAKYGILFPVGDVKSLTEAIQLLLRDKNLYEKYRKVGRKRAEDFSVEKIVQQYKEVLLNG